MSIEFKVEMYVDEQLSDTCTEVYIFSYDQSNQVKNIHLADNNDDVLKELLPSAQRSFRNFAGSLVKNINKK